MSQIREDLEHSNDEPGDGPELEFLGAGEIGPYHYERYAIGDGARLVLAPSADSPIVVMQSWSSGAFSSEQLESLGPSADTIAVVERSGARLASSLLPQGLVETWVGPIGASIEHVAATLLAAKSTELSGRNAAAGHATLIVISGRLVRREVLVALRRHFPALAASPASPRASAGAARPSAIEIGGWLRQRWPIADAKVEERAGFATLARRWTNDSAEPPRRAQWSPVGAPDCLDVWTPIGPTETASIARARIVDQLTQVELSSDLVEDARRRARIELEARLEDPIERAWLFGSSEQLGRLDEIEPYRRALSRVEPSVVRALLDRVSRDR